MAELEPVQLFLACALVEFQQPIQLAIKQAPRAGLSRAAGRISAIACPQAASYITDWMCLKAHPGSLNHLIVHVRIGIQPAVYGYPQT